MISLTPLMCLHNSCMHHELTIGTLLYILRYLKGTLGQEIMLHAASPIHITGWSDSDWASCSVSRRSVTGWLVQIGTSMVSWKSQKQETVSLSSTKTESRAMT